MSNIKGYVIDSGYRGYVPSMDKYMLFSDESDYLDYINDPDDDNDTQEV